MFTVGWLYIEHSSRDIEVHLRMCMADSLVWERNYCHITV